MTTFPARVIAEYERTKNPIIGRALETDEWGQDARHGWLHLPTLMTAREAMPFHTRSLAYCLLMELRTAKTQGLDRLWFVAGGDENGLLETCIEAGRSGA